MVCYALFEGDRMASEDKERSRRMAHEGRKAKAERDAQYSLQPGRTVDTLSHPEPVSMNAHHFL